MTGAPTVRPRTDADVAALADVLVGVHAGDGYPVEGVADPRGWLRRPGTLGSWVAEVDRRPVGQVTLVAADDHDDAARVWCETTGGRVADLALVVRLFVDRAARGTGAATLLMAAATDHARAHGLALALDVMDKDRAAIRFYERLGARLLGPVVHRHSGDRTEPARVYAVPT